MVKYPKKGQNIPLFFLKHICEGLKINISKNDPMYFQLEIAQCFISESFRKIGDKKYFSQICLMELSQRTEERSQRVFRNSTMIVPTIIAYAFLNPGFSIFVRGGTEQKKKFSRPTDSEGGFLDASEKYTPELYRIRVG